jgi:hypothetical protein
VQVEEALVQVEEALVQVLEVLRMVLDALGVDVVDSNYLTSYEQNSYVLGCNHLPNSRLSVLVLSRVNLQSA